MLWRRNWNALWWTEECAAEYRAIRRIYPRGFCKEVQMARKDFQRVVRREKRLYWRNLVDSFSNSASIFKAVKWLRSPGAFQPPLLQVDEEVYETQHDKAEALRRATLERRTAEDDIPDPWIPNRRIAFAQEVTPEEVKEAVLRTGNTLVTMDIQGAFDTVMRNRLSLRLRQQGWPDYLDHLG
ncbi:hypothetical protein S40288_05991 [Stachybotrys chartarum IBT 40288]|nr:hypothetical protein S40288_05991 [Stachybotrys chartarum IBT 40288]